jgi:hypothetical protein
VEIYDKLNACKNKINFLNSELILNIYRGQFEYELVLRPDLYTRRHTQWYYFRVQNMIANITYRFRIVNLMKKNSLYNEGKLTNENTKRSLTLISRETSFFFS